MNNDRELLQQALHYMDDNCGAYSDDYQKLIEAIRARLSQCNRCGEVNPAEIHTCTPKREWQGLMDEEIEQSMKQAYATVQGRNLENAFARAIEAKLKAKNT